MDGSACPVEQLRQAVDDFVGSYNQTATPFEMDETRRKASTA